MTCGWFEDGANLERVDLIELVRVLMMILKKSSGTAKSVILNLAPN